MTGRLSGIVIAAIVWIAALPLAARGDEAANPFTEDARTNVRLGLKSKDSPQWGRTGRRNNVAPADRVPRKFDVATGENIKWTAKLGSQTYSTPVIANSKVFIGTNNGGGRLNRFPPRVDSSVLLCFDAATGAFLWQHSNEKLPVGRVQDWEQLGCCCSCYVEGKRLWYVSNRNEVVFLDTEGFRDGKNDGPYLNEPHGNLDEADCIWSRDRLSAFG